MKIKPSLRIIAERIPLPLYRMLVKRDVLGLNYHVVSDKPLPHIQHRYIFKNSVSFENDLVYLKKHFNLITYDQLVENRLSGHKLKPRSLILTFDDGFAECFKIVRPLLLKHKIPCVFFITTNFIDNQGMAVAEKTSLCTQLLFHLDQSTLANQVNVLNAAFMKNFTFLDDTIHWIKSLSSNNGNSADRLCQALGMDVQDYLEINQPYMTTNQIRQMHQDGFTIGAHSLGHQDLRGLTKQEVEANITASCKLIQGLTGKAQIPFAFPHSADGISRDFLKQIRERHDNVGLLFDSNGIRRTVDFIVSRMCGDSPENAANNRSNLPIKIARAYLDEIRFRMER